MTDETRTEAEGEAAPDADAGAAPPAEPAKLWQPSGKPEHRADQPGADNGALIIERGEEGGFAATLLRYLKRPFVKLVVGLGLFILAAIVYDETINFGSWTERAAKPKPAEHRGAERVPLTPDG